MYRHILAPIDGSEPSILAFSEALRLARESGADLQPLYVVDVPPGGLQRARLRPVLRA